MQPCPPRAPATVPVFNGASGLRIPESNGAEQSIYARMILTSIAACVRRQIPCSSAVTSTSAAGTGGAIRSPRPWASAER